MRSTQVRRSCVYCITHAYKRYLETCALYNFIARYFILFMGKMLHLGKPIYSINLSDMFKLF